jgi:hypothetical protein
MAKGTLGSLMIVLVACICGWFVMVVEILGVRMLAPYFGSAVYVVTGSVIGVFLLSLSIGYMLGGWLSTKPRWQTLLGGNICIAGVWIAVLPLIAEPVCDFIFQIGLDEKWGSLIASLILFGVPTILLGTVSPTVIRWLSVGAVNSGFNAGVVMAASTIASFAGCVVTAFYLVLLSMGLTLMVSGLIVALLGMAVLAHAILTAKKKDSVCQVQTQQIELPS